MKITKFGHSCLLVEESGARILIDPGSYSTLPEDLVVDAVLLTHEHDDHCYILNLNLLLKNNKNLVIYTSSGVAKKLEQNNIAFKLLENGQSAKVKNVLVEGFGKDHAVIYKTMPHMVNVGYRVAEKLFYGGDSLEVPNTKVEILAYPAIAPWLKCSEAVDFAKAIKPKICFPVHDAFLTTLTGGFYKMPKAELAKDGIAWTVLNSGEPQEF